MISRAQYAAPTMNATMPQTRRRPRRGPRRVGLARRPQRLGRGVGRYVVESVLTFSVFATHINCYIYIIIVYEYVRDMYGL